MCSHGSCRLLNCASDKIRNNYIAVLNQLLNRHLMFKMMFCIDRASDHLSPAIVQLCMNKVDMELEQFMKLAEMDSHKYKRNNIQWSPYSSMWIHQRWLLKRVQTFLSSKTLDLRNIFHECSTRGIKDPRLITRDKLKTDFFACKHNIEIIKKNSPFFRLKFLKGLAKKAKCSRNMLCISKITGIIEKEASRKLWRRINKSTRKARGGLTVAVKVPTTNGGHMEYKSKEGVFEAVGPIILKWFQSALVAQCHRGKIFEDIGHLADGSSAQQILEGTYEYPDDLDPATRLLFEEALATYKALSPTKVATYVTPEDFKLFWWTVKEQSGSSYSGLHFGHYIATSHCPDLLLLHATKLSICDRNGVSLARWGKGLTVLLEIILGNIFP
jgi:hypothetical protein